MNTDYLDDEEEQIEEEKKLIKAKSEYDKRIDDIRLILETPEGMRFFKNFLDRGRIFSSRFDLDPIKMAYNEGKNSLCLSFTDEIMKANPAKFPELIMRHDDKQD